MNQFDAADALQDLVGSNAAEADHDVEGADPSEFEEGEFVPTPGPPDVGAKRRSSIFSVRFTSDELDVVATAAVQAGLKPGAFIRRAAIEAAGSALTDDRDDDDKVLDLVAALRRSIETAQRHRAEQAAERKTTA